MRVRLKLGILVFSLIGILFVSELVARFVFGLGDPPLSRRDFATEYVFMPGEYSRFGNSIQYNHLSMRSPELPQSQERRILVAGDSVINGGALTDQSLLATSLLSERFEGVWFGNVSAGSWGPENIKNYFQVNGWFEAEAVFFVINTSDLADVMRHCNDLGPNFPTRRPMLALQEVYERYLPRYIPALRRSDVSDGCRMVGHPQIAGRNIFAELLRDAIANVPRVVLLLHPKVSELGEPQVPERDILISTAQLIDGVEIHDLTVVFEGRSDAYRDNIHLNEAGQYVYFEIIASLLEE